MIGGIVEVKQVKIVKKRTGLAVIGQANRFSQLSGFAVVPEKGV